MKRALWIILLIMTFSSWLQAQEPGADAPLERSTLGWWPIWSPGHFFTPDWWRGAYGLQLNVSRGRLGALKIPADLDFALQLSWAGIDTVSGTIDTPVVGKTRGFSALINAGALWPAAPGLWISTRAGTLLANGASTSSVEASGGVLMHRGRMVNATRGPELYAGLTAGLLATSGYGTAEGRVSWYLPLGRLTVVSSLYGVQALSPSQPLIRLPALDSTPRAVVRNVGDPLVDGESLAWNVLSADLSVRPDLGTIFSFEQPITGSEHEIIGTETYSLHLVLGLSWFSSLSNIAVASSVNQNRLTNGVGLTLYLEGYRNEVSTGPELSLQIFATIDSIARLDRWYVALSKPLNPVTSGFWM